MNEALSTPGVLPTHCATRSGSVCHTLRHEVAHTCAQEMTQDLNTPEKKLATPHAHGPFFLCS